MCRLRVSRVDNNLLIVRGLRRLNFFFLCIENLFYMFYRERIKVFIIKS